jgi:hypothetical protein
MVFLPVFDVVDDARLLYVSRKHLTTKKRKRKLKYRQRFDVFLHLYN